MEFKLSDDTSLTAKLLQRIAEGPRDIIFILSSDGVIQFLNPGFESVTGWQCREWLGKSLRPLIEPSDLDALWSDFKRACEGQTISSFTSRIIKKNGERALLDGTLLPEWNDGKVCQVMGMARDITDKIKTEEARLKLNHEMRILKEVEADRERALFLSHASSVLFSSLEQKSSPTVFAEIAVSGMADWSLVILRNQQTGLLETGCAAANPEHIVWAQQIQSALSSQLPLLHPISQIYETGQPKLLKKVPLSYLNLLADQPEHRRLLVKLGFFSAMGAPLKFRGQTAGALLFISGAPTRLYTEKDLETAVEFTLRAGIMMENTQLYREVAQTKDNKKSNDQEKFEAELIKARDEAVRLSQFKSEFVANVSHEIRTPINAIVGMTSLLMMSQLTSQQQNFLETIRISCDALISIINDILDLSKIESGKMELEIGEFNPRQLVESVVDLLAPRAMAKGLELVTDVDPGLPPFLKGDAGRLRQVLMNLGSNAVKFTERGEVVISVEKKVESDTEIVVDFLVRDTGIGISEAKLSKIFEPFAQADISMTRKYGGSGLGLTISKMFVELMKGTISVKSEPGTGSDFSCQFPFEKVASRTDDSIPSAAHLSMLRILVADDNKSSRQALVRQLRAWGVRNVTEAANANETFDRLQEIDLSKRAFHIIFLDKSIVKEPPFVVIKDLLKTSPNIKSKLFLLTPLHQPLNEKTVENLEVAGNLLKPIKSSALLRCLLGEDRRIKDTVSSLVPKSSTPPDQKSTVLVVEDNSINQQVVLWQLKELGYRADAVGNGMEALEALNRYPYNLVLMDCQMPEMDGFDATARIRKNESEGIHTPIIAMTAHATKGIRDRCLAVGMNDCLIKPVTTEDLSTLLVKWQPKNGGKLFSIAKSLDKTPFRQEMLTLFLKLTPPNIDSLEKALKQNNFSAAELEAHRLSGSCLTMGFEKMVHLSRKIEKMAGEQKRGDYREPIKELRQEFEAVQDWIHNNLQEKEIH